MCTAEQVKGALKYNESVWTSKYPTDNHLFNV